MNDSIPDRDKCPECGGCGCTEDFETMTVNGVCKVCRGTGRRRETPQPTAIAGTDSARRCAEGASEAVVDGAAPLCDGLVELERYLDGRWSEAIAVFNDLSSYRLDGPELAAVRSAANARRSLVEVREYLESVGAISPAQSERSQP